MGFPAIRFTNIRPLDGSQHTAFEEVCCQLAAEQPAPKDSAFVRKGRGGDGGVECLRRYADGSEHGWQAKYVFAWSDSLATQLDASIETALQAHPRLTRYTVCIPFDLPDARSKRAKSARQKWDDWRKRWVEGARADGRALTIDLWGQSQLISQLTSDPNRMAGRVLYWFDEPAFSDAFFRTSFNAARATLGSRYTPETNIELPIRQDFLALTRDPSLQDEVDRWFVRIGDAGTSSIREIQSLGCADDAGHVERLQAAIAHAVDAFRVQPTAAGEQFPVGQWRAAAESSVESARAVVRWVYSLTIPPSNGPARGDPRSAAIHQLRTLLDSLEEIVDALSGRRWGLVNQKAVLLTGHAGSGKSHLLADIVQHQVEHGLPALLIPSHQLVDAEPWHQILSQLHRPPTEEVSHFLGALDTAAQTRGVRALICIDALNERHGVHFWCERLPAFLAAALAFPHVAIVVSCRTTYVPHVVPEQLMGSTLHIIDHLGFGDDRSGAASRAYLDARGIVRPGVPSLLPEFNNPLFLKTCCDLLEKQGVRVFPRGLRGVTAIFKFYFDAVTTLINRRLGLDPHAELIPRAIAAFVDVLVETGGSYVNKVLAYRVLEGVRPSGGRLADSLLSQLTLEGLLSIEPGDDEAGRSVEYVRFTFERYSDYAIAERAIDRWLDKSDPRASFAPETPLGAMAFGDENYLRAGVVEALSVLLPERTGVELIDLAPGYDSTVLDGFRDSLLWRVQTVFSGRTYELLVQHWSDEVVDDILLSVGTEPDNAYNARFIDQRLRAQTLPQRDSTWSISLAARGFEGEIKTLISWALTAAEHRIEPERAELAATLLTWFLTTPHRAVRDRATKGLAALLADRLDLAAELLTRFRDVDDPYVIERLLAACYGAVLQGRGKHLADLAGTVDRLVFGRSPVLEDILARDHALGILEYAASRSTLPQGLDLDTRRPPYTSAWPIEFVPDELIETYVEKGKHGTFNDSIVSSTINDGDFARYIMDRRVDDWSPAPISAPRLPTAADQYGAWEAKFLRDATAAQRAAFDVVLTAADAVQGQGAYQQSPEMDAWKAALQAFRSTLPGEAWEAFRAQGLSFVRFGRGNRWMDDQLATFDTGWARRWVCKRAHDLGWTPELFADFERTFVEYGRREHRIERFGKKYQWIAFRELLARMADNLAFIGAFRGRGQVLPASYERARQVDVRDIDPSLLLTRTHYENWRDWPPTWWSPIGSQLRAASLPARLAWLDSPQDVLTGSHLVDVTEPNSRKKWLVLSLFAERSGKGLHHGQRESQRQTWYRVRCIVVPKGDFAELRRAFTRKKMLDVDSFEHLHLGHDIYLGEFPWHPDLADEASWSSRGPRHARPASAKPTTVEYRCEASGYDQSIDQTVGLELPAPWLARSLGLQMVSGRRPCFVDQAGQVVFFDPSVEQPGPTAALVDHAAFFAMLQREGLEALWVINGDKDVWSGATHRQELVGRYSHTQSYWWDQGWKSSKRYEEFHRPDATKLETWLVQAEPSGDSE